MCTGCGNHLVKNGRKSLIRHTIRGTTTEKVQQWWCQTCRSSFTFRATDKRLHFTAVFVREAVKDFIQGRSPVAVIHERKDVSVGTISSWVRQYGDSCMSPEEISEALELRSHNHWSGILLLDAKYLNKRQLLLLAVDYGTLDIVAWLVVDAETVENYTKLVDMIEACGYVIRALISDGHPAIIVLTHTPTPYFRRKGTRVYPRPGVAPGRRMNPPRLANIPHQWCVVHALRDMDRYLVTLPKTERVAVRLLIHDMLLAHTYSKACRLRKKLEEISALAPLPVRRVTAWIRTHWETLTVHHAVRIDRRRIPKSSNAIENTISYVNTRLKTMRRLRTTASATAITNLIVVNYRTKCFRSPTNHYHRGKSPLALATRKNKRFDWMRFIKKSCS
jgi:transposase-like protein